MKSKDQAFISNNFFAKKQCRFLGFIASYLIFACVYTHKHYTGAIFLALKSEYLVLSLQFF